MPEYPDREEIIASMRYLEGRTWKEIQEALSVPSRSMDRIRARIRKKMKLALEIMALIGRHKKGRKRCRP